MFIKQISINEVPAVTTQPLYIKDNRYKSGKRFIRNISVPDVELKIKFTKKQVIINVISAIITYIPSIVFFWIFYRFILS